MPRLAVVIPTYNEAKYLPGLFESLRAQTLQPSELVVADAQSTDDTREIAARYGATVVEGGLPSVGRNRGAAATTAEVIVFLDADALLGDEHFLAKAVKELDERNIDLATASVRVYNGTLVDKISFAFYNRYVRFWMSLRPHPLGTFMLVRRLVHNAINGFNERVVFAEDQDYGLRAQKAGYSFAVLDSVRIGITPRRQERDGRWRFLLTNALAEPYMMLFGPITSDVFRYRFGYDQAKKPTVKNGK